MLEQVKNALGITGTYQDITIQTYIDEVVSFLVNGGVDENVIDINPGIVARGVSDLWNYGSGSTGLSPYFMQRASQLALGNNNISVCSSSIYDRLSNLETTTTDHENRIDTLEITTNNQANEINNINDTISEHETRITDVEENKADTEYVDDLVGDIGDVVDDINGEVIGDNNG